MKIQADEEGKKAIQSLCGVVIESIGGRMLPLVNHVLSVIKGIPPQEEVPVPNKVKKKINKKPAEAKK